MVYTTAKNCSKICLLFVVVSSHSKHQQNGFRSVVVITLASHARGPEFEPQRKHFFWSEVYVKGGHTLEHIYAHASASIFT